MCALHLSARHGALESVRVLLEAGADPNEVTTEATTPLFLGDTSFLEISEQPVRGGIADSPSSNSPELIRCLSHFLFL